MKRLKKKKLFFAFVDLEKPFDWVPGEVILFALRQKVDGDMSLYKDCKTAASVGGKLSSSFSVKVGRCILVVSVESGLVVILFSARKVRSGFIIVVLMYLGR